MGVEEIRRDLDALTERSPAVAASRERQVLAKQAEWITKPFHPLIRKDRDTGRWLLRYYQPWTGIMVRDFPTWDEAMSGYVRYVTEGWY